MVVNFDSGILRVLLQHIFWNGKYWFGIECDFGLEENLFTLSLVCKS